MAAILSKFGGAGAGSAELAVVSEQMGATLLCAPYLSTAVLTPYLLADLGDLVEREQVVSPAILVIGEVVLLSDAENRLNTLAKQGEALA
jgi:hypothetical protein